MLLRIGVYSVVLASSCLTSRIMTPEAIAASYVLANKTTAPSEFITTKPITVSKAEFGVFRVDNRGKLTFISTTKVPLQEGNKYGWRIKLKNYQGEVTWREVIRLPKSPETWGTDNGENFNITPKGNEGLTTRKQFAKDGVIWNSWTVVTGDPIGKHTIFVYINNRRIASFEFEVVPNQALK